jgi:hypothetical protein
MGILGQIEAPVKSTFHFSSAGKNGTGLDAAIGCWFHCPPELRAEFVEAGKQEGAARL